MAHTIEVHLAANVEKYNQGMAAAKKTGSDTMGSIATMFATVKSYFAGMWDSAKSFFSNLGDKGAGAWDSFKSSASGALDKVLSMLPGVGKATKDIGDEAEQADKKTDSWLSKIATGLAAVVGIAIAAAAAVAALAAKGLLIDSVFAKVSIATNVGAGELSKFQDVAKRSGMTIEQLGAGVTTFQSLMKEAAAGTGGKVFKELGVDVKNSKDELLATAPTLVDFAKHVAAMSSEAEKYEAAAKSGFKVQFLEDLAHASKLAASTTDDQAAAVTRLGKIFHEILPSGKGMLDEIGTSLSNKLTPALTTASIAVLESKNKILDAFTQIYGGGSLFDKLTDKIKSWADSIAGYFANVVKSATSAAISVAAYIAKATGLGGDLKTAPSAGFIPGSTPVASGKPAVVATKADEDAAKKYDEWTKSVLALAEAQKLELQQGTSLTQGQRMQLALLGELKDGNAKETDAQVVSRKALIEKVIANEKQIVSARQAQQDADALAKKQAQNYANITASIQSKIAQDELELLTGNAVTDGQKIAIKVQKDLEASKKSLTAAQIADTQAQLAALDAVEKRLLQGKAEKEVANYIEEGAIARMASRNALEAEYESYGKNADALALLMVAANAQNEMQKELDKLRKEGFPISGETIKRLEAETAARTKAGQAVLSQSNALKYATQLADENKRFAAESIFDEKARAAALLQIDVDMWQQRIDQAGAGTEAQKRIQEQYDIWIGNQKMKPQIEEQRRMWESIESTAHDTFVSIFDSGKSAFDRLRDTLKNGLMDLLYQMVIKKWVLNIGASVGLTGAGGLAQAANAVTGGAGVAGSNGLIGMAQTASAAYKAITSGFEGLSTSVANGVQSAMSAVGYYPSAASGLASGTGQALTPFASGAGSLAGIAAGAAGGIYGGRLISGQYGSNATVNVGTAVGAAVGSIVPVIGTALGALVGGLLGGVANRLFGMGDTKLQSQGISGTLSSSGLTGSSYQNLHQDGGWFRSDKNWTDTKAFSTEMVAQFTQGFDAIKSASAGFATALGASVDSIASYSKDFNITLTGDAEANKKAVADFFNGVGDEIALRLVPNLAQFSKTGETVSATLERLAGDFQATNQVAMLMGVSGKAMFGSLGVESAAARERLIELAGGVSNLSAQANTFAQNYLTEAERLAPVSEAVAAAMASLGMASVTTREQFKEVVQGLDVTTAAGAQQFASMMALADSFAQVHPLIEAATAAMRTEADILSERKDLQKQFDQATMTSAQLRSKERLAIDASNLALFDQITNLQTIAATSDALKTSIDKLKSFKDGILSFRDSLTLGSLSTLNPMQKAAEAQRQYEDMLAKARAGDETARAGIQGAATAYLTADQIVKASSDAYVNDAMKVQADLMALADAAGAQISVDQLQLTALDNQVSQMVTLNTSVEGLRADNSKLREDNAKLLSAVQDQTAVLATVIVQAAGTNAKEVSEGSKAAATSRNWKLALDSEAVPQ